MEKFEISNFLPSSSSSFEAPLSCPLRAAWNEDVEKFRAEEIFQKFDRWNKFLQARNSALLSTKFFCWWWHNLENDRDTIRWQTGPGIRIRNILFVIFVIFARFCYDLFWCLHKFSVLLDFFQQKLAKNFQNTPKSI